MCRPRESQGPQLGLHPGVVTGRVQARARPGLHPGVGTVGWRSDRTRACGRGPLSVWVQAVVYPGTVTVFAIQTDAEAAVGSPR